MAVLLPTPLIAQDRPFCEAIVQLQTLAPGPVNHSALPHVPLPTPNPPEPTCGFTLGLSGSRSVYCGWPFAYRSEVATEAFEALLHAVSVCVGGADTPDSGSRVNIILTAMIFGYLPPRTRPWPGL